MDNFLAVLRMLVRACEEGKLTHWNKWVFLFDCVGGHDELSDHHSHCCVQTSPANHDQHFIFRIAWVPHLEPKSVMASASRFPSIIPHAEHFATPNR